MQSRDLSGRRFGRLLAQSVAGRKWGGLLWLCICDCGREHLAAAGPLVAGTIKSCGCLRVEGPKTHGRCYTPEYRTYAGARERCTNPRHISFPRYGGIGTEFRFTSFEQFFSELGERPPGTSIDRVDPFGHYEPGNVRWATPEQQARNKRKKVKC